jgi:hypothetical protein
VANYYTAESLRKQILRVGRVDNAFSPPSFPDNWEEYCPCHLVSIKHCSNNRCTVKLAIFFNNPNIGQFPIEIIYLKEKENGNGYIRVNQIRLKTLIDNGVIDKEALESVFL